MRPGRGGNHPGGRPGRRPRGQKGFSLLEVMIALVLTGSVVVALLQLTRAQMTSQAAALDRLAVLDQAGELMSQWLSAPQVAPGIFEGAAGSVRWTVEIVERVNQAPLPHYIPQNVPGLPNDPRSWELPPDARRKPAVIYAIKVCGRWQEGDRQKELCLESERIAPAARRTI